MGVFAQLLRVAPVDDSVQCGNDFDIPGDSV